MLLLLIDPAYRRKPDRIFVCCQLYSETLFRSGVGYQSIYVKPAAGRASCHRAPSATCRCVFSRVGSCQNFERGR